MHKDIKRSRLLVISDIHGHTQGLELLLREADYRPGEDRLILLGDYIDSDPRTVSALNIIKNLVDSGARALPGNQETTLMREPEAYAASAEVLEWLRRLPGYIEEDSYLFVHAGIRPGVPMDKQSVTDLTEIREEFWQAAATVPNRTVIFGHTPTYRLGAAKGGLWFGSNRIGIDTGAKHGCRLTLFDIYGELTYSCSTAASDLYGDFKIERVVLAKAAD